MSRVVSNDRLRQALALCESKQFLEAQSICASIRRELPAFFEGFYVAAVIELKQARLQEAEQLFRQALQICPDSADANHDLGVVAFYQERFDDALECLERAITLRPSFSQGHCTLGQFLAHYGYFDLALSSCRRSVALDANFRPALEQLGNIERMRQDFDAIVSELRTVRRGNPPEHDQQGGSLLKRQFLPHLLNRLGLTETAVEVGVQRAKYSEHILRHWNGKTLISVDPWREFQADEYVDVSNVSQELQDANYIESIKRLRRFGSRSTIWRLLSKQAASLIDDSSLDFCFIDAGHSYEAVREDLSCWYPKIVPGGILAGHDYIPDGEYRIGKFGVQMAVHEFVKTAGLRLYVTGEPKELFPSWFVVKPS